MVLHFHIGKHLRFDQPSSHSAKHCALVCIENNMIMKGGVQDD